MQDNAKKPAIRFAGFNDAWEQRKFADLGAVAMCKRIFKEQTLTEGDVPFYKIGTFGGTADAYISRELFEEYKALYPYPEPGAILISASGSIGRTVEFSGKDEYFQDSNIVWFKHDDRLSDDFLKCLYGIIEWAGIEGSTIKRLYNDNFLKTEFMMPCIEEQKKIGQFFKQLDHLIALHQRKYTKLVNIKKSMLEKMFPQNGSNVPEIRFAGFTDAWEQRKLGERIEECTSRTSDFSKYPLFSLTIENGVTEKTERYERGFLVTKTEDLFKIVPPSCFVTNPMNLRFGAVGCNRKPYDVSVSGYYDVFSIDEGQCSEFWNAYLKTRQMIKRYDDVATGSLIEKRRVHFTELKKIEVPAPTSIAEKRKIGEFFLSLDHLIALHQRKLERLQNIKKACLEKMFV